MGLAKKVLHCFGFIIAVPSVAFILTSAYILFERWRAKNYK